MSTYSLIEFVPKLVTYMLFFSGIWLLVKPYLKPQVIFTLKGLNHSPQKPHFIKSGIVAAIVENSRIYHHCNLLLQSTWKFYTKTSVANFFILSLSLFASTCTIYFGLTGTWLVTVIASAFSSLLPYITLRMVLQFTRTNTSYQLGPAVGILLAGYRMCNNNIYFAILHTIKNLEDTTLKKSFIILANHIQNHKNMQDIKQAIELFVFKIQTSWAKQLGVLLLNALLDGREIGGSLNNLVNDMKEGQKILEQEKSNSHETVLLGYLPLIGLPLTIWFMASMSGQFNILHHQFKNPQGLASFTITAVLCIAGFLLALFLRNPKNDL